MVAEVGWTARDLIDIIVDYFRRIHHARRWYWPIHDRDTPAVRAHFERLGHRVTICELNPNIIEIHRHG